MTTAFQGDAFQLSAFQAGVAQIAPPNQSGGGQPFEQHITREQSANDWNTDIGLFGPIAWTDGLQTVDELAVAADALALQAGEQAMALAVALLVNQEAARAALDAITAVQTQTDDLMHRLITGMATAAHVAVAALRIPTFVIHAPTDLADDDAYIFMALAMELM